MSGGGTLDPTLMASAWLNGSRVKIALMVSAALGAPNARWPVSISNSTAPSEKMSDRPSTGSPRTCSGDI